MVQHCSALDAHGIAIAQWSGRIALVIAIVVSEIVNSVRAAMRLAAFAWEYLLVLPCRWVRLIPRIQQCFANGFRRRHTHNQILSPTPRPCDRSVHRSQGLNLLT